MSIFKRKSRYTQLKERVQSLEEKLGIVFVRKDDWDEHQADSEAYSNTFERRLKNVEEFVKDNDKKGKK